MVRISQGARRELMEVLRRRYSDASKTEKSRILDEFAKLIGCHRKHAVRLLGGSGRSVASDTRSGQRVYTEAVRASLVVLWEAADRICGKRLKAILPSMVDAMERHGHLALAPNVRERLLGVSASTIDRLLRSVRQEAKGRRKRRRRSKPSQEVPVRTFADWSGPAVGYFEIDFVAHCGGCMEGRFIHSLVGTDVCSGWTEAVPLLVREQSLVVEGLEAIQRQLPFALLGFNSDNDGAFINETLVEFARVSGLEFTRSRPYRSNDQAWIEQKNGSVVRRFVGYDRYAGPVAGQALAVLYHAMRLYVNYFQPSFKLLEKTRHGARVTKRYDTPMTPCDRLLQNDAISVQVKERLTRERALLDPIELLHRIRQAQSALSALTCPESGDRPGQDSVDEFLAQLPRLWLLGEVRPTHRKTSTQPRHWRTRKDPFESIWPDVLLWLQQDPDIPAKMIFHRLRDQYPGRFSTGQLRTLQRRVREWRAVMAKQLVYACMQGESSGAALVGERVLQGAPDC